MQNKANITQDQASPHQVLAQSRMIHLRPALPMPTASQEGKLPPAAPSPAGAALITVSPTTTQLMVKLKVLPALGLSLSHHLPGPFLQLSSREPKYFPFWMASPCDTCAPFPAPCSWENTLLSQPHFIPLCLTPAAPLFP